MVLSIPAPGPLLPSLPPSCNHRHSSRTPISSLRNSYPRLFHRNRLFPLPYRHGTDLVASISSSAAEAAVEATNGEGAVEEEEEVEEEVLEKERMEVVVHNLERRRLVLKFVWMEKNIGLGLDQAIPGHGTFPLGPFYFWPSKDAWEELKTMLESKPWISQRQTIILLNQATDIINLWQHSGGGS